MSDREWRFYLDDMLRFAEFVTITLSNIWICCPSIKVIISVPGHRWS